MLDYVAFLVVQMTLSLVLKLNILSFLLVSFVNLIYTLLGFYGCPDFLIGVSVCGGDLICKSHVHEE